MAIIYYLSFYKRDFINNDILLLAIIMKIKLIFCFCSICILITTLTGCNNKSVGFVVKGDINDQNGNLVYLEYNGKIDSTRILNDVFQFEGNVNIPTQAFIRINKSSSTPWILGDFFMLENNTINISLDYSKTSKEDEIHENFRIESIVGSNTQKNLDKYYEEMDIGFHKEENDTLKAKALFELLKKFLGSNPQLKKGGEELVFHASKYRDYLNVEKTEFLYSMLDTIYQEKEVLDKIRLLIKQRKNLIAGSDIPQFTLKNLDGEIFDINQNISEFTLIDFWASWCMPCRSQNPELVKLYNLYKDKGLEIVSISIDEDLKAWKKAVKKDDMNWINLSDSNQLVADKFYLFQIPMTILIDKTGKIIERDLEIFSYNDSKLSFAEILNSRTRK